MGGSSSKSDVVGVGHDHNGQTSGSHRSSRAQPSSGRSPASRHSIIPVVANFRTLHFSVANPTVASLSERYSIPAYQPERGVARCLAGPLRSGGGPAQPGHTFHDSAHQPPPALQQQQQTRAQPTEHVYDYVNNTFRCPDPLPPLRPPVETLSAPWRKVDWDKEVLLKRVKEYDREGENIKHIRILLHGPVGAGKSSFINSATSCLRETMIDVAPVDTLGDTSFTLRYRTYTIKTGKAQNFPVVFNDIMGLESKDGIQEEDIKLAMKGHVKDGYTFNPVKAISDTDAFYNHHPDPEDKVHVLVCVVPADQVALVSEEVVNKIRRVRLTARDLDIPQICIITKIDVVHALMEEDIKNVYRMKIVEEKMQEFSDAVGIPMKSIFPVKNYHKETDLDNDADVLILKALQHMINMGEVFIDTIQ